jgi:hypothetical protein
MTGESGSDRGGNTGLGELGGNGAKGEDSGARLGSIGRDSSTGGGVDRT